MHVFFFNYSTNSSSDNKTTLRKHNKVMNQKPKTIFNLLLSLCILLLSHNSEIPLDLIHRAITCCTLFLTYYPVVSIRGGKTSKIFGNDKFSSEILYVENLNASFFLTIFNYHYFTNCFFFYYNHNILK